jgi:DNA-binding Lrp family transcriptional regulator
LDSVDDPDRKIINGLQENFPLEPNPYDILAARIGIGVDELWRRVTALVESGVIRRLGFSIDSRKLGYAATLAAIKVPPEEIDAASNLLAEYPQVTHCYLREDAFNIWFTVIDTDTQCIAALLGRIREQLDLSEEEIMDLPAEKLYKLDTRFRET